MHRTFTYSVNIFIRNKRPHSYPYYNYVMFKTVFCEQITTALLLAMPETPHLVHLAPPVPHPLPAMRETQHLVHWAPPEPHFFASPARNSTSGPLDSNSTTFFASPAGNSTSGPLDSSSTTFFASHARNSISDSLGSTGTTFFVGHTRHCTSGHWTPPVPQSLPALHQRRVSLAHFFSKLVNQIRI